MPVTVVVKISHSPQLQTGLWISLGIKLHQLDPIRGHEGQKGDKMLLFFLFLLLMEEFGEDFVDIYIRIVEISLYALCGLLLLMGVMMIATF